MSCCSQTHRGHSWLHTWSILTRGCLLQRAFTGCCPCVPLCALVCLHAAALACCSCCWWVLIVGCACSRVCTPPTPTHLCIPNRSKRFIAATFLWGCMASYHGIVDETADVHSTNICMLEVRESAWCGIVKLKLCCCLQHR